MATAGRDPETHRFTSDVDLHALFAYVRDVVFAADPARPWTVSKRAFDAARKSDERFAGGLTADGVLKRVKYPWSQLLAVVTDPERDPERSIASHNRRDLRPVISIGEAVTAMKFVAGRLGAQTLRPQQYDDERLALVDQDSQAWLHGGRLDRTLPTSHQIERALRLQDPPQSWDDGLRAAGLQEREAAGGHAGISWPELIDMFMDELGFVPNSEQARAYAVAKNVRASSSRGSWPQHLKDARSRRRERGAHIPRRRQPGPIDFTELHLSPVEGAPAPLQHNRSLEESIEGLVLALDRAGTRSLTMRLLKRLASEDPAIPSYSVLQRNTKRLGWPTFPELRAEAAKRRAESKRRARDHGQTT